MNDMLEYMLKRLVTGIFVIFSVTMLLFMIMQLMPGDPIKLVSDPRVPAEKIEELRKMWGLDKPAYIQYFYWLSHVVKGDFGTSISTGQKVSGLISARLPYTLLLAGCSLVLQYIIAVPLGLMAAYKKNTAFDKIIVIFITILGSIPGFWLGILLILLLGVKLNVLPISGYSGIKSAIMPILTLTLPTLASTLRLTRGEVLEVLRERYVLTAYAKGVSRIRVLVLHVLRNALIPVTVMFSLSLPWLVGGSVIIENIFAWPGMGMLLWKAISNQDFPIVQGVVFIIAILTVISNIAGDILTALLDPKIRLEMRGENI